MRIARLIIAATMLGGCFQSSTSLIDGGRPSPTDSGASRDGSGERFDSGELPPPPATRDVDMLFLVDNSNSMTEEQASLTAEFPRLVDALTTGDADGDGVSDFEPVESLNLGVVTTDMGVGGHTVPTCERADLGDDGVLRTQGASDATGCMANYPSFLAYDPSFVEPEQVAFDLACITRGVGTGGCGFEQQLEAPLKALSPSAPTSWTAPGYAPPMFFRNTYGHGDRANDGFVRDGSILAVVMVTDEEDCSAADPELYNPSSPTYGATDLNLRCWAYGDTALHPISRYVEGLLQLRTHPSRLVYAVIAGVPTDLASSSGVTSWERLVGPTDGTRDERMVERVDPAMSNRLVPSCNVPGRGLAFPPVRIVQVGRELEARGAEVTIQSICQEDYDGAIEGIVRLLGG